VNGETGVYQNESPQRRVAFAKAFAVGKFEVTIGQYAAFLQQSGHDGGNACYIDAVNVTAGFNWRNPGFSGYTPGERDPVACVDWNDAQAYVAWLSQRTGQRYRLLTEAEWEYAARGGSTGMFPWGIDANGSCAFGNIGDETAKRAPWWQPSYAGVTCDDAATYTTPVGRYQPNGFGIHDMIGNLNEWVADCYVDGYATAPTDGSAVEVTGCQNRSVRGAGWSSSPYNARVAARTYAPNAARINVDGIRVARDL
jgi:formylglycine-generating enzyme required for sulfatase activity